LETDSELGFLVPLRSNVPDECVELLRDKVLRNSTLIKQLVLKNELKVEMGEHERSKRGGE
jgi:hypothetical protein